jgi:hypothetical protein
MIFRSHLKRSTATENCPRKNGELTKRKPDGGPQMRRGPLRSRRHLGGGPERAVLLLNELGVVVDAAVDLESILWISFGLNF